MTPADIIAAVEARIAEYRKQRVSWKGGPEQNVLAAAEDILRLVQERARDAKP